MFSVPDERWTVTDDPTGCGSNGNRGSGKTGKDEIKSDRVVVGECEKQEAGRGRGVVSGRTRERRRTFSEGSDKTIIEDELEPQFDVKESLQKRLEGLVHFTRIMSINFVKEILRSGSTSNVNK